MAHITEELGLDTDSPGEEHDEGLQLVIGKRGIVTKSRPVEDPLTYKAASRMIGVLSNGECVSVGGMRRDYRYGRLARLGLWVLARALCLAACGAISAAIYMGIETPLENRSLAFGMIGLSAVLILGGAWSHLRCEMRVEFEDRRGLPAPQPDSPTA